jgi:hypothetical protein
MDTAGFFRVRQYETPTLLRRFVPEFREDEPVWTNMTMGDPSAAAITENEDFFWGVCSFLNRSGLQNCAATC